MSDQKTPSANVTFKFKDLLKANRITAVLLISFGLLMVLFFIPLHTETVDYGWIEPATIPKLVSAAIVFLAILLFFFNSSEVIIDGHLILRGSLFCASGIGATLAMSHFGFLYTSPLFALTIMLVVGERRSSWLFIGTVIIPVALWFIVEILLQRQLP